MRQETYCPSCDGKLYPVSSISDNNYSAYEYECEICQLAIMVKVFRLGESEEDHDT